MSAPATDRSPTGPNSSPLLELSTRVGRAVAHYREQHQVDQNQRPPRPQFRFGKRFYETAPIPLPRLLGSPLARSGRYATGPENERVIASGWGDARSDAYDAAVNTNTLHAGLDFTAAFGETIFACADGIVTFVGYQHRRRGGVSVDRPHQDDAGEIRNRRGVVVARGAGPADQLEVGFGGIIVFVEHTGDFAYYRTEYMHCSDVLVRSGDRVAEGTPIARVGGSGGYRGHFDKGIHLHFQVALVSGRSKVLVRPTGLVPNFWPGHEDSTTAPEFTGLTTLKGPLTVGESVAASTTANQVQAVDRATTAENQGFADFKRQQAAHSLRIAQQLTAHQTALYEAIAKFQGGGLVVQGAMTFDFDTGLWKPDGQAV